ncbi:MAG TPA: HEAT repeat domain-containing protein [Kofleriaceae bacterium]|nr:HEAT repeat domain-containing protein [Kofleriaceae bacterium]
MLAACADHAHQAVALYEAGDYAGAARAADSGLAAHPGDEGLWQMRVRAALAQGDGPGVARAYATYRDQLAGEDDKELLRELAIATLRQALASPSVKLKIAAIDAVAAAELMPLAEQVAERMTDDDDRVVASAAIAVLHGYPQAPQAAGEMLHSEDPEARRIAVEGIGNKVGKLAITDLEAAGADPDPRVRRAAIRWLGQLKDAGAVELLTRHLHDPDDAVRAAAASALARIGVGNLAELGRLALQDRALAVRLAGIELMVAGHATAELARLDEDPDPIVAAEAALARGGGAPAARAIERAATADEWTIRAGAANLAERALGKPAAVALARKLAADREPAVRLAAARVLAHAGDPRAAAELFVAALRDPDHALAAATDLAQADDPRGVQALDAAVGDREHGPAARAAAAAAHQTAHRITPGLVGALADDSGVVRVASAAALAMLTRR